MSLTYVSKILRALWSPGLCICFSFVPRSSEPLATACAGRHLTIMDHTVSNDESPVTFIYRDCSRSVSHMPGSVTAGTQQWGAADLLPDWDFILAKADSGSSATPSVQSCNAGTLRGSTTQLWKPEERRGKQLVWTEQRKGTWVRSSVRTQSIEAVIEGVVLALRTVGCSCSKQPTYVSECSLLSGKLETGERTVPVWRVERGDVHRSGRFR